MLGGEKRENYRKKVSVSGLRISFGSENSAHLWASSRGGSPGGGLVDYTPPSKQVFLKNVSGYTPLKE